MCVHVHCVCLGGAERGSQEGEDADGVSFISYDYLKTLC